MYDPAGRRLAVGAVSTQKTKAAVPRSRLAYQQRAGETPQQAAAAVLAQHAKIEVPPGQIGEAAPGQARAVLRAGQAREVWVVATRRVRYVYAWGEPPEGAAALLGDAARATDAELEAAGGAGAFGRLWRGIVEGERLALRSPRLGWTLVTEVASVRVTDARGRTLVEDHRDEWRTPERRGEPKVVRRGFAHCGGKVDVGAGESPAAAAARETEEELGIALRPGQLRAGPEPPELVLRPLWNIPGWCMLHVLHWFDLELAPDQTYPAYIEDAPGSAVRTVFLWEEAPAGAAPAASAAPA